MLENMQGNKNLHKPIEIVSHSSSTLSQPQPLPPLSSEQSQEIKEQQEQYQNQSQKEIKNKPSHTFKNFQKQQSEILFIDQNPLEEEIQETTLDIGIMYSDPLVAIIKDQRVVATSEPVDFQAEINNFKQMLTNQQHENQRYKLDFKVDIATTKNFLSMLLKKPKILHFICHGDFNPEEQKFYLSFEKEDFSLDRMTTEKLKQILQQNKTYQSIQLVFVNACHSEEVGRIFLEAGIPYVVAVQSDLKIEELAAQTFSQTFYLNLLNGQTIDSSFKSAQTITKNERGNDCYTCCCAHKHEDDCLWQIDAWDHGYEYAHRQHTAYCNCPNKKQHYHIVSKCDWAYHFLCQYDENFEDDEYFELEEDEEILVCCCKRKEEKKVIHDESLKFQLMYNPELHNKDEVILGDKKKGRLTDWSMWTTFANLGVKLFGRQVVAQQIMNFLTSTKRVVRFVQIVGELGIGKTILAKYIANHLYERGYFRNEINIQGFDFERVRNINYFENRMLKGFMNMNSLLENMRNKQVLFVLDNCDDIIKNDPEKFSKILKSFEQGTTHVRFLILNTKQFDLNINEETITLEELPIQETIKMLLYHCHQALAVGDHINELEQLSNLIKPRIPKNILATAQQIKSKNDLKKMIRTLSDTNLSTQDFSLFQMETQNLIENNQEAFNLLLILSIFPYGLSVYDLKFIEKLQIIKPTWKQSLHALICKGSEVSPKTTPEYLSRKNSQVLLQSQDLQQQQSQHLHQSGSKNVNSLEGSKISSHSVFCVGEFFYLSISKMDKLNALLFKVKKFIIGELKKNYQKELLDAEMKVLEFLAYFSKQTISCLKSLRVHHEGLVEYTGFSVIGLWAQKPLDEDLEIQLLISQNERLSLEQQTPDLQEQQKIVEQMQQEEQQKLKKFRHKFNEIFTKIDKFTILFDSIHQNNFYTYLSHDDLHQLIDNMANQPKEKTTLTRKYIETLCQNIPSIYHILKKKEAEDLCLRALEVINRLGQQQSIDSSTTLIKAKLHFQLISIYLQNSFFRGEKDFRSFQLLVSQIKDTEEITKDIEKQHSYLSEIIEIEILYIKAYIIYENCTNRKITYDLHKNTLFKGLQNSSVYQKYTSAKELLQRSEKSIDKLIKNHQNKHSMGQQQQKKIKDIEGENNKIQETNTLNLVLLKGKIQIMISRIMVQQKSVEVVYFDSLHNFIPLFKERELEYLEVITRLTIGQMTKEMMLLEDGPTRSYSSTSQQQETLISRQKSNTSNQSYTDQLLKTKKEILDPALKIINYILQDKSLEKKVRNLIDDINQRIRQHKLTIFQFMRSAPLVDCINQNSTQMQTTQNITRVTSSFRDMIKTVLEEKQKQIFVKFEVLTQKNFLEAVEQGCSLLYMDLYVENPEGIVIEDDILPLQRIRQFQGMKKYFGEHPDELGSIEVMIIGAKQGRVVAQEFINTIKHINKNAKDRMEESDFNFKKQKSLSDLNMDDTKSDSVITQDEERTIPYIITFDFKDSDDSLNKVQYHIEESFLKSGKRGDDYSQQYYFFKDFELEYLKRISIQFFSSKFIELLVNNTTVQNAFNQAKTFMLQQIINITKGNISEMNSFEKYLGVGPYIYEDETLVKDNNQSPFKLVNIQEGRIEDISSAKATTNIARTFNRNIGRNQDIYKLMQLISNKSLNIFGPSGCGKSDLVQELGIFFITRNYFKDGVFYFKLKNVKKYENDLLILMKNALGEEFHKNSQYYFQDKQMLLIFDDFDYYYKNEKILYFDHVFTSLRDHQIPFIIVTKNPYDQDSHDDSQMKKKKRKDLLYLFKNAKKIDSFRAIQKYQIKNFTFQETFNFIDSLVDLDQITLNEKLKEKKHGLIADIFKKSNGNPNKIIKLWKVQKDQIKEKGLVFDPKQAPQIYHKYQKRKPKNHMKNKNFFISRNPTYSHTLLPNHNNSGLNLQEQFPNMMLTDHQNLQRRMDQNSLFQSQIYSKGPQLQSAYSQPPKMMKQGSQQFQLQNQNYPTLQHNYSVQVNPEQYFYQQQQQQQSNQTINMSSQILRQQSQQQQSNLPLLDSQHSIHLNPYNLNNSRGQQQQNPYQQDTNPYYTQQQYPEMDKRQSSSFMSSSIAYQPNQSQANTSHFDILNKIQKFDSSDGSSSSSSDVSYDSQLQNEQYASNNFFKSKRKQKRAEFSDVSKEVLSKNLLDGYEEEISSLPSDEDEDSDQNLSYQGSQRPSFGNKKKLFKSKDLRYQQRDSILQQSVSSQNLYSVLDEDQKQQTNSDDSNEIKSQNLDQIQHRKHSKCSNFHNQKHHKSQKKPKKQGQKNQQFQKKTKNQFREIKQASYGKSKEKKSSRKGSNDHSDDDEQQQIDEFNYEQQDTQSQELDDDVFQNIVRTTSEYMPNPLSFSKEYQQLQKQYSDTTQTYTQKSDSQFEESKKE